MTLLSDLKLKVCKANLTLPKAGLVTLTWGNVSGLDEKREYMVIKPSGVSYDAMRPEDMVVVRLSDGETVEGGKNPSSDTQTHLTLYRAWPEVFGIVHTHSRYATVFAQAALSIPALGTTHADSFYGEIPLSRQLTPDEMGGEPGHYEAETGKVILETLSGRAPLEMPGVLVRNHGPFTWGKSPEKAVENAVILEEVAQMAYLTRTLNPAAPAIPQELLDRHFLRKHGKNAYYGQK